MRKRDCAFLTYLQTAYCSCYCHIAITFKNQRTAYFSIRVVCPPMQMHHKISGVTGPNFTKFLVFFIDGIDAAIRLAIRPSIVE